MVASRDTVRDKLLVALLVAVVNTFIFGALLAIFGYWLDTRLESYKQALAEQTEKTKSLLASLQPDLQQRRKAYREYLDAIRCAKETLAIYYFGESELDRIEGQISSLRNELGIGSGSRGASFVDKEAAVNAIERMVQLRKRYEDVASREVTASMDKLIETLIDGLKEDAKGRGGPRILDNAARKKELNLEFGASINAIEKALGVDQMAIK